MIKQEMMQAIIFDGIGDVTVIKPVTRPIPTPRVGEVLIKVMAAGMNRADILQRLGKHPPAAGESDIPGLEVAGVIVGTDRRVCALVPAGGYAQYVCVSESLCFDIPDTMDFVTAAALPEALFTVTKNIFLLGGLQTGEHLLIHGGASGIGTLAIQMAKLANVRITVTAGNDARCALCRELGADRAINHKSQVYTDILRDDPVDVVLDMVGGETLARDMSVMAFGGRHVSIAFLSGAQANIDIAQVMKKRLILTGSMLRHDSIDDKAKLADIIRDFFWYAISTGQIKPVIDTVFRLSAAQDAHSYFETGVHAGKIILSVDN